MEGSPFPAALRAFSSRVVSVVPDTGRTATLRPANTAFKLLSKAPSLSAPRLFIPNRPVKVPGRKISSQPSSPMRKIRSTKITATTRLNIRARRRRISRKVCPTVAASKSFTSVTSGQNAGNSATKASSKASAIFRTSSSFSDSVVITTTRRSEGTSAENMLFLSSAGSPSSSSSIYFAKIS